MLEHVLCLDSYVRTSELVFDLNAMYHSMHFYVVCCECGNTMVIGIDIGVHDNHDDNFML
jgi:hypothetical protein